jgi:DNA (cytosine-5)-methyltransferase 1
LSARLTLTTHTVDMPKHSKSLESLPRQTAVDLFAGYGGLTQGLRDAGFHVLAAIELDELAADTYRSNHPTTKMIVQDIRTVTSRTLARAAGVRKSELDLLTSCPPCQGFSRIRRKNKPGRLVDYRNRLIDEVLRFVEDLSPKVVLMENVPALREYSRFRKFTARLTDLGYQVRHNVVDAADFGVPQRRKRLVTIASRIGDAPDFPTKRKHKTVRDAIGTRKFAAGDPLQNTLEKRTVRIRNLIRRVPRNGGSRRQLPSKFKLQCHRVTDGFYDVYGRMSWDSVAPTITGGCVNPSKGRFLHPSEDRAITLREAALLQGFPPTYKFSMRQGKYRVAELIGNAFPPTFSRMQAQIIRQHLRLHANDRQVNP